MCVNFDFSICHFLYLTCHLFVRICMTVIYVSIFGVFFDLKSLLAASELLCLWIFVYILAVMWFWRHVLNKMENINHLCGWPYGIWFSSIVCAINKYQFSYQFCPLIFCNGRVDIDCNGRVDMESCWKPITDMQRFSVYLMG